METNELKEVAEQWRQMALAEQDPATKQEYSMNYITIIEQLRKNQETDQRVAIDLKKNELQAVATKVDILGISVEAGIAVLGIVVGLWYDHKGLYTSQESTKGVICFAKNVFGRFFKRH